MRPSSSLCSSAVSHPSSHTASGKHCYFITFVFPSLQSGTRDVRASSSLCSSAASHPSSHTASGRHCCNVYGTLYQHCLSYISFNTASGKHCCNPGRRKKGMHRCSNPVSIPQAVGTVATTGKFLSNFIHLI